MAADVFRLQELLYNDEASFMANGSSMALNTYANRIPILEATASLEQERVPDMTVQARKNESRPGYLGLRRGSIEFTCYVPGAAISGDTASATWFHDLLSDGLGGDLSTDDVGTLSAVADADTMTTTNVTALTPGAAVRIGVKGDSGGDGMCGIVSTWAAGALQLVGALPATPAIGAVVRPTLNQYPTETNPSTTKRFLLMHKTSGAYYQLVGCQLDSVTFDIPVGEGGLVRATFRYVGALWDQLAASSPASLPSSVTMPNCDTAVIAGGQFIKQTVGTTTRNQVQISSLQLTLNMGLIPETGPATSQPNYTNIYGWVSRGCVPTITYTQPWSSTEKTDFDTDGSDTTHKYFLFQTSGITGRIFGFFMPRCFPVGTRPTTADVGGLLHQRVTYQGREGTDTTSELTRSAIRFFQA